MNINNKIRSYIEKYKNQKRRFTFTAFLSLLVTLTVVSGLIMPAVSMTYAALNEQNAAVIDMISEDSTEVVEAEEDLIIEETSTDLTDDLITVEPLAEKNEELLSSSMESMMLLGNTWTPQWGYKPERYNRRNTGNRIPPKPATGQGTYGNYFESAVTEIPANNGDDAKLLYDGYNNESGANDITSMTIIVGDQTVTTGGTITVPAGDADAIAATFEIGYEFNFGNSGISKDNPCIYYQLPDGITIPDEYYGVECTIIDSNYPNNGSIAGYYSIDRDGLIVIQLTDAYLDYITSTGTSNLIGTLEFNGNIERANTADGDQTIEIDSVQVVTTFNDKDYTISKNGKHTVLYQNGNIYIQWKVEIVNLYPDDYDFTSTILEDAKLVGATDISVVDGNGAAVAHTISGDTITFNADATPKDNKETIIVTYKQQITAEQLENYKKNQTVTESNTATFKTSDDSGISDSDSVTLNPITINKIGQSDYEVDANDYNEKIKWTINVNSPIGVPLAGFSVKDDTFTASGMDRLTVTDASGNNITDYTLTDGVLTFGSGVTATGVHISYYSAASSGTNSNTATLNYNNTDGASSTAAEEYTLKTYSLSKNGTYNPDSQMITWNVEASGGSNFNLTGYELTDAALENVNLSDMTFIFQTSWGGNIDTTSSSPDSNGDFYNYEVKIAHVEKDGSTLKFTVSGDGYNADNWRMPYRVKLSYTTEKDAAGITSSVSGDTVTYSNSVSDNYDGNATGTASFTPEKSVSKSYVGGLDNSIIYDGNISENGETNTLNWKLNLISDAGYSDAIVDLISVDGDGDHYFNIGTDTITVKAGTISGTYDTTLTSDQYTITYYSDSNSTEPITSGHAKKFQIQIAESVRDAYRYIQVEYTTTAVINKISLDNNATFSITFNNTASFGDSTSTPSTIPSVTIKDKEYIEKMNLTVGKQWTNLDSDTETPTSISYIIQRRLGSTGEYETVYKYGNDWVIVEDTDGDGKYTIQGQSTTELTDYPYTLTGGADGQNWQTAIHNDLPRETTAHNGYYQYKVVEVDSPEGYTVSYSTTDGIDNTGTITITNRLVKPATISKKAIDSSGSEITSVNVSDLLTKTAYSGWIGSYNFNGDYYLVKWQIDVSNMPVDSTITDVLLPEGSVIPNTWDNIDGSTYPQFFDSSGMQNNSYAELSTAYADNKVTATFKVKNQDLAKIVYYTAIPKGTVDAALTETASYSVTNTVQSSEVTEAASATLEITKSAAPVVSEDILNKTVNGDKNSDGNILVNNGIFEYSVIVNPEGKKLSTGDTLDLADTLNVTSFGTYDISKISAQITNVIIEGGTYSNGVFTTENTLQIGSDYSYTVEHCITESENVTYKVNETTSGRIWLVEDFNVGDQITVTFTGTPNSTVGSEQYGLHIHFNSSNTIQLGQVAFDETGKYTTTFTVPTGAEKVEINIWDGTLSSDSTITVTGTQTNIHTTRLNLTVPDATPMKVTYRYQLYYDNEIVTKDNYGDVVFSANNEITLDSGINSATDSADDTSFVVNASAATITTDGMPSIKKTDISNYGLSLNAKFYAAKYDAANSGWYFVIEDPVTSSDSSSEKHQWTYSNTIQSGDAIPDNAVKVEITNSKTYQVSLETNTLYKLIEVEVPDGYEGSNLDFTHTTYKSLEELIKTYLSSPDSVTDQVHLSFLNKYVSTHYFSYQGIPTNLPTGVDSEKVTNIASSGGALRIYNNNLIDITVNKSWAGVTNLTNYRVKVKLYWSYKKSNTFPTGTDLNEVTASDLGLPSSGFNAEQEIDCSVSTNVAQWSDLPTGKYDDTSKTEKPIYYYVKETAYSIDSGSTWYELQDDGSYKSGDTTGEYTAVYVGNALNSDGTISVTNASGLTIKKEWFYADNVEMVESDIPKVNGNPVEIPINVYGVKADKTEELLFSNTLTSTDSWQKTFTATQLQDNLPDGKYLSDYTTLRVEEDLSGFDSSVFYNYSAPSYVPNLVGTVGEYTIVNKSNQYSRADVVVEKVWGDGNDTHTSASDYITVKLYRSTRQLTDDEVKSITETNLPENVELVSIEGVSSEVTLNPSTQWQYTWLDLPVKSDSGDRYYYYPVETSVPEGYEVRYDRTEYSASQNITITNYKPGGLTINKKWKNDSGTEIATDQNSLTLKLYKRLAETTGSSGGDADIPADLNIVALGDSITKGSFNALPENVRYPYVLQNTYLTSGNGYDNASVYTVAEDGRKIDDISAAMTWSSYTPDIVCVIAGTNDIINSNVAITSDNTSDETLKNKYESLLSAIYAKSSDAIVFVGSIPRYTALDWSNSRGIPQYNQWSDTEETKNYIQQQWDTLVTSYNSMLSALVAEQKAAGKEIYYVDIKSAVGDELYDGCHPNADGYAAIANAFYQAINTHYGGSTTTVQAPTNIDKVPDDFYITGSDGTQTVNTELYTYVQDINLDSTGNWSQTLSDLESGYVYYVVEESVPTGWSVSYSANGQAISESSSAAITVTNTRTIEKTSITVNKMWIGGTSQDITNALTLQRSTSNGDDATWTDVSATPTRSGDTYTYSNLDKTDSNGSQYYYRVQENFSGYEPFYDNNDGINTGEITIKNIKLFSLKVKKEWIDGSNNSVNINIYRSADKAHAPIVTTITTTEPAKSITLSAANGATSLKVGETLQLTATLSDSGDTSGITYESSNTNVATVDVNSGLVTGVSNGSVTITASKDGYTAGTINLTVNKGVITLNPSTNQTMTVGDTLTITPTPSDASLTSSDPTVVSVNENTITALKAGTATITASKNGYDAAAIIITVNEEGSGGQSLPLYLQSLSAGDKVTVNLKYESGSSSANGCLCGNINGTWSNEYPWEGNFNSNGELTVVIEIDTDISDAQFQVWWPNSSVTVSSYTIEKASSETTTTTTTTTTSTSSTTTTTTTTTTAGGGDTGDEIITGTLSNSNNNTIIYNYTYNKTKGTITITIDNDYNDGGNVRINTIKSDTTLKDLVPISYSLERSGGTSSTVYIYGVGVGWGTIINSNQSEGTYDVSTNTTSFANYNGDVGIYDSDVSTSKPYTLTITVSTENTLLLSRSSNVLYSAINQQLLMATAGDGILVGTLTLNQNTAIWKLSGESTGESITCSEEWQAAIANLPAYDDSGNAYYYWAEEDSTSAAGYDVSYSFDDGDGDTVYCINASNAGNSDITVQNKKISSATMPSTGGVGVGVYYYTGGAMVLLSMLAGVTRIKRRKK